MPIPTQEEWNAVKSCENCGADKPRKEMIFVILDEEPRLLCFACVKKYMEEINENKDPPKGEANSPETPS